MIKAVLFDLDGVLADVEEFHCRALSGALAAYKYAPVDDVYYRDYLHRYPTTEKLRILWVREADATAILALKDYIFFRLITTEFVPDPRVIAAMKAASLDERRPVGVVSNGSRATLTAILSRFPGQETGLFGGWCCGEDGPRKPAPDLYLRMARRFDVRPEECVVVEDRDDGIAAAKAAGMRVVVVTGPQDVTVERMRAEGLT